MRISLCWPNEKKYTLQRTHTPRHEKRTRKIQRRQSHFKTYVRKTARSHYNTKTLDMLLEVNKPYQLNVYDSMHMHIHKQMNAGIELMNADEREVNSCLFNPV
jgi:hypothetical protein